MQWLATIAGLGVAAALGGCAASHEVEGYDVAIQASSPRAGARASLSSSCKAAIDDSVDGLPDSLSCTGLYADLKAKKLSPDVRAFQPAFPLWSDGAVKHRWIFLPEGATIDASSPSAWVFPVGTKAWKEFNVDDQRIETRLLQKQDDATWAAATYEWNADESTAKRSAGGDITAGGETYHLPTSVECTECHGGRKDRLLGFDQVNLGLPLQPRNATADERGLTLADLVDKGLIENLEGGTDYTIGDDGTGLAADALGWMHTNCGVTCHNDNSSSKAYARGMRLMLDPTLLDGRDLSDTEIFQTTLNVDATTLRWNGDKRIVPGSPDDSLLYQLITQRGDKQQQMPPLASRIVDEDDSQRVGDWIAAMGGR